VSEEAAGRTRQRPVASPVRACLVAGLVLSGLGLASPALADAKLARAKNCMACHATDKKLIGPSYKDVAIKYAGDRNAVVKLAKKVRDGGVGVWGQIPMPANPQVSDEEATRLVNWILVQK
jgi:cytochrome c